MNSEKRQRGGQPKDPSERKRNNLTFRARDRLKSSLAEQAEQNSRSLSEEIEHRLEMSLAWERAFGDPAGMRKEMLESALRWFGYQEVAGSSGVVWLKPPDVEMPPELVTTGETSRSTSEIGRAIENVLQKHGLLNKPTARQQTPRGFKIDPANPQLTREHSTVQ